MYTKSGDIYFYLGLEGWVIDNQIVPKGYHRLRPSRDLSELQVEAVFNLQVFITMRPVTNYLRENDTPYEDYDTFISEVGSFFVNAPPTGGISGTVDTYSELPTAADKLNEFWLVRYGSGVYLINRKPAGLYISNGATWDAAPNIIPFFSDLNFRIFNNLDNLKQLKFDVSAITSGQTRNVFWPDSDVNINAEKNTICVSPSGCTYTTVGAAMDSITDNTSINQYVILVGPGVYSEDNPIQCKEYVSVRSTGGSFVTSLVAVNAGQNMFNMSAFSVIRGINVINVTGVGYAFNQIVSGNTAIIDCISYNCSNGIYLNHADGLMNINNHAEFNDSVTTTKSCFVEAGNLTISKYKVGGVSSITTLFEFTGINTIITINEIESFSPNLIRAFDVSGGCRVAGSIINLVVCTDGLVIYGNDTQVRIDVLKIFNCLNDGLRIDNTGIGIELSLFATTISGCSNLNFNILNPNSIISGNGFTELDKGYIVNGAEFYAYLLDVTEGDEGLNIFGELHVGTALRPTESVFGSGDSHTYEYAYTESSANVFTDVTIAAVSYSGSTFIFDGVDADSCIYIANRHPLTFGGIKILIDTAATMGGGSIIAEYWNGAAWTEFNGCISQSSGGFLKYAKEYFDKSGSYHIKYNPYIVDDWVANDPISPALGTNYYWIRYRIVIAITTSPIIQQIKIHTDRTEINGDGTLEFHSNGRTYKKLSLDASNPIEGNMQSSDIYVDENVGVGYSNNRFTATGDIYGFSFELPEDCDTSGPLILAWKGKFASSGNAQFTVRMKIVKPGDAYTNSEPAASGDTLTVLSDLQAVVLNTREDFKVYLDISEAIPSRENGFGDEIWITVQNTTRSGNFDHTKYSANYLSDFNGRHILQ